MIASAAAQKAAGFKLMYNCTIDLPVRPLVRELSDGTPDTLSRN
jgi:hypothetical protein